MYCKQHHPPTVAQNNKERSERWDREHAKKRKQYALKADAPTMLDMLRRLEWADGKKCPICRRRQFENRRHAPDCELSAILKRHE
jgi:hypothetical protein